MIVLGVAALLRVIVVIAYRPALFFTGDSVVYLDNAMHLVPGQARPILYAVFLDVVLKTHHLALAPVLQHLMGLATATVSYVLLRHLGVAKRIAVLGTLFVLFDPLQLVLEENLLSESLFQILIVLSLAVLVWRRPPAVAQCVVVGLGLAAATLTRNVGVILILPVLVYALALRFGWRRFVAILVAFGLPLLVYAGWYDSTYGSFALQGYSGRFLYGRVAPFADCQGLNLSRLERNLCLPAGLRSQWPTWWVFGPKSPLGKQPLRSDASVDEVAQSYALTVIEHQPFQYLAAVSKDFVAFFNPVRTTGADADPVNTDFVFRRNTLTAYPVPAITDWIHQADGAGAHPVIVHPLANALIFWQRHFYVPGPVFLLAVLAGFGAAVGRTREHTRRLGAEGVLYSWSAALLLVVPVATVVFDYRFLVPPLPLLGTAGAIGITVFVDRFHQYRSHRSGSTTLLRGLEG